MLAFDLKRMDTRPHKEIGNDFFLGEGKYIHEPFVSRFCLVGYEYVRTRGEYWGRL
jgi:hypothetical protein